MIGYAFIREGQCLWAEASGRFLDQDQTHESLGFNEDSWRFAAGAQFAVSENTHVNVAAAYEQGSLDSATASADVDRVLAGIALKHQIGSLMLSAALSGGKGWYDDERKLSFPGFNAVATADHDVSFLAGRLRAAWLQDMGNWYVKPLADVDLTRVHLDGFGESGGGGAALAVNSDTTTVFSFSPAIEIGSQSEMGGGVLLRPYLRAGLTAFSDTSFALTSNFLDGPADVPGFVTATEVDRVLADVSVGLNVLDTSGMVLELAYDGLFGETVEQHSVGAKASVPF